MLSNVRTIFRLEQRERIDPASAPQTAGFLGLGSAHVEEVSRLGLGITADTHHPEEEDGLSGEQKTHPSLAPIRAHAND